MEDYQELLNKDISMGEVAVVNYGEKIKTDTLNRIITSTILVLHVKGYVRFENDEKQKVMIILKKSNEKLKKSEQEILDCLIKSDIEKDGELKFEEITLEGAKVFYDNRNKIKDAILEEACEDGYIDRKKAMKKGRYEKYSKRLFILGVLMPAILMGLFAIPLIKIIALIFLVLIFFISPAMEIIAVIFLSKADKINVFTEKASKEKELNNQLEEYLKKYSLIKNRKIMEVYLWEKYLAYATIFDISKNVLDSLNVNFTRVEEEINFDVFEDKNK